MLQFCKSVQFSPLVLLKPRINYYSTRKLTKCNKSCNNIDNITLAKYNLNFSRKFSIFCNHNLRYVVSPLNYRNLFISQTLCECPRESSRTDLDLEKIQKKYPQPKGFLHNFFSLVAMELQKPEYCISPQYKLHPSVRKVSQMHWNCIYSIKWPQEMKFQKSGSTKQEAASKAAWSVLMYLQQVGKINSNGVPMIYDSNDVRKVTNESNFCLKLSNFEREYLNSINDIFVNRITPLINKNEIDYNYSFENNNNAEHNNDTEMIGDWFSNQKISPKRLEYYRAKELVDLPVQNHKQELESLLDNNRVILVRGETGCGKSTRIPQYVLEHFVNSTQQSNARIIVTQPRKIAAISLAERVAQERNEKIGNVVGYQVRLNSQFNPRTGKILYCTTGILLRQIQADPNLSRCTHVILDEAHERDVNTDLLMNLIRQALQSNPNLKLIIMSATIDAGLFQKYFNNPPVINIPGRAYPVKAHFLEDIKLDLHQTAEVWNKFQTYLIYEDIAKVVNWIHNKKPEGAILVFLPGWQDIIKIKQLLMNSLRPNTCSIVTIHSKLSHDEQRKIFRSVPPGVRKIILATNIAETSVTVNDVVYVVDSGIHKETRFNSKKGLSSIDNHSISQSSVQQRKGRAGRVQPGESFHIYPKYAYSEMLKFSLPEILRVSLTKIVLDAKVYSHNVNSQDFFSQLPCAPHNDTVAMAVEELQDLGMLDEKENLTPLGRIVSDFQLPPKLSKAMIQSVIYKCVVPIVDIATLFSFDSDIFANTLTDKNGIKKVKMDMSKDSDHIALMILYEQWANMMDSNEFHEAAMFCTKYNLVPQKLSTLKLLKDIHYDYLEKYLRNTMHLSDEFSSNKEFIKGVLLSGVGTVLLQRNWNFVKKRLTRQKVFLTRDQQKATITSDSVNHKKEKYESPFLVYINEMRSELRRTTIIRDTSIIQPLTFVFFKGNELTVHEISEDYNTDIIDPVLIKVEGTKFNLLCNRGEASILQRCKKTLREMENYFVYQLTKGGEEKPDILENWNQILHLLDDILRTKRA